MTAPAATSRMMYSIIGELSPVLAPVVLAFAVVVEPVVLFFDTFVEFAGLGVTVALF
jgi:hypothetical protein